jgi:hypothetical protein
MRSSNDRLHVRLVARERRHLNVNVLERNRVDGGRDAVDVGRVCHRSNKVPRRLPPVAARRCQGLRPLRRHGRRRRRS